MSIRHVDLPHVDRLVDQHEYNGNDDKYQQKARDDHAEQHSVQHTLRLVGCVIISSDIVIKIDEDSLRQ